MFPTSDTPPRPAFEMKRHRDTGNLVGEGRPEQKSGSQFRVACAWQITAVPHQIGEQIHLELIGHNHDGCNYCRDSDNGSQNDSFVLCDPIVGRGKHQLVPNS